MGPRLKLVAAFGAVYIIWGSTYLAIRYGVATIPPLLMAGLRSSIAGAILYGFARGNGQKALGRSGWMSALVIGTLMLAIGNGGVCVAELWVPSGVAALVVAMLPLWIALLSWILPGGRRPAGWALAGILFGLLGVGLLVQPGTGEGQNRVDPVGVVLLLCASLSWAAGTLYSRKVKLGTSLTMSTAMQMLAGGFVLLLSSAATGEWSRFELSKVSGSSVYGLLYLIFFGSLIAYTSYTFLVATAVPSRVATYAYVNPVIAVLLGWAIASEPITTQTLLAMGVIIGSVVIITRSVPSGST
jgi:drug/metabolite transporter (DMT)-like permease